MSDEKDTKKRTPRLPSDIYTTMRSLTHGLYDVPRHDLHRDKILFKAVQQPLLALVKITGLKLPDPKRIGYSEAASKVVTTALRRAYTFTENDDPIKLSTDEAKHIFRLYGEIERAAKASEKRKNKTTARGENAKSKKYDKLTSTIHHRHRALDPSLEVGDTFTIATTGKAPIGKLVGFNHEDGWDIARVCDHTSKGIRLVEYDGDYLTVPASAIIGPVIKVEKKNADKIERLKDRLAALESDDDHTLNITKIFEVEREIYDLEHPIEEEAEDFEWPDEISGQ